MNTRINRLSQAQTCFNTDDVRICMCLSRIDVRTRQAVHKRAPRAVLLHVQHLHEMSDDDDGTSANNIGCGSIVIPSKETKHLSADSTVFVHSSEPHKNCTLPRRHESKRSHKTHAAHIGVNSEPSKRKRLHTTTHRLRGQKLGAPTSSM